MIGVISDTHGLLRTQVMEAFLGVDLILHAGDIGDAEVLAKLQTIAPVIAVRGNNDRAPWATHLPVTQAVEKAPHWFYLLHELAHLDLDPGAAEMSAVIFGHSHRPLIEYKQHVLFLNPGSAGPRRFSLPVTVARLTITATAIHPEIIALSS